MKQETLVFTALFLIFLVVNLPTAIAANLVNVQAISGKDNVNSVRREEDQLKVEASVVVAEGSTENLQSNLFLRQQIGALQFETCTATGGNTFLCKVTVPKTGTDRKFGLLEYSIVLFPGQTGKEAAPQTKIAVDNEAPRVESVAVSNNKITGGDVELQYTVKDTACPTCQNACAGIKQVDVYHAEGKSKLQSFAVTENKCTLAETKNLNLNSLPNGRQHLCVVPMDKFDQVSGDYLGVNSTPAMGYNCIEIQKDNSKPEIVSVELHYPQSRELADYVSYQGMLLTIGIEVKTKVFQLKNNAVTADLTQLGLAPVNVPCQEEFTNQFFCEHTFKAKLSQDGSKQIKVTAEDEMGNKQEKTESMELKMDSDTPQVERLGTAFTYQDGNATKSVFGLQNNTLVAVMQEQGSGFDRNQVFFEIEGNRLQASCEGNTCRYAGYGMRTSANQLVLGVKGTDDVGHAFQHQATVPVDRERATLVNASLINLNFKPFLVEGDAILVQVGLRDSYGISEDSTADFSQFSNSYQEHPTCEKTSDGFACTWHVFSVLPTPIVTAKFNILDTAHNLLESVVQQFSILFVREDTVHAMPSAAVSVARDANANASDFWMLKPGEPMPNFVDADTLEVTNYRIWFPVQFSQRGGLPVKIADVSFNPSTCTGEDVGLLEDISFVNPDVTDFSKSFIKFTLAQGAIEQDTIKFSCEISTVSKQGGLIYPEENDQVNLTIPVLRAGEISEAVVEEIKDVRGSWLVEAEFIGTLNKWLRLGKNICNFLAALGGLLVKLDNSEIVMEPMEHHP
ncbi:hypothetical protein HYS48_01360, partial [Candidatus Woesearchaeota archaeon]|nr:hypothetical protein [Candidatus Woesearchaeota archaeon]